MLMASSVALAANQVLVVGAGGAGLIAGLSAAQAGASVTIFDAIDPTLASEAEESNTARSTGLVPAACSALQATSGILDDSPEQMAADILRANGGQCDNELLLDICRSAGPAVDWLQAMGVPLECKRDFLYHGHSRFRMHGPPSGYGRSLVRELAAKAAAEPRIRTRYGARVAGLLGREGDGSVSGVRLVGGEEVRGCAVVLATCGFGGSQDLVRKHLGAALDGAYYLGSPHDDGGGVEMGAAAGGELMHMRSYQGHASVTVGAVPRLVTYGVVVNGGILVGPSGERFGNEDIGYSEYSAAVLRQGRGVLLVFGAETAAACEGTRLDEVADAVQTHESVADLAAARGVPLTALQGSVDEVNAAAARRGADRFGRTGLREMRPPLSSVRVQSALFHTQGGLRVDNRARVLRAGAEGGATVPRLFAAGGTAAGVSGDSFDGYLSGNGLLMAVVLGKWAGEGAAELCGRRQLGEL